MTYNTTSCPLSPQVLDALLGAAGVSLNRTEYLLALAALGDLDAQCTQRPRNFAERAVVEACAERRRSVEKAVGLALDAAQRAKVVTAVEELLTEAPRFAPDAHLEMEYEERVWGGYSD